MKSLLVLAFICQVSIVFSKYYVPRPDIDALSPVGFRVTIPHEDGIELLAFHGNINQPMNGLEAGRFSQDVRHRSGKGHWVFYDRTTPLHVGDTIYFWLYVQKNGIGYRYDNGVYHVTGTSWSSEEWD